MHTPFISTANAKQLAAKAHEARKRNKEAKALALQPVVTQVAQPLLIATYDPYASDLMHAQTELLAALRSTPEAKDKAALAQALKNLRETYHLATGLAKPGVRKPERQSSRAPSNQAAGPELPTDTTTGSVPT